MIDAGFSVQRRPSGNGLLSVNIAGVAYPLFQISQQDMNAAYAKDRESGGFTAYPVYWCERGHDWIQVYPRPHIGLPCAFSAMPR